MIYFYRSKRSLDIYYSGVLLSENQLSKSVNRKEKPIETETTGADERTKSEIEYLEKAVSYYHKSLLKNEKAIA